MQKLLPGAASFKQFVGGLHGTCGPTATYEAMHILFPDRYPLTPEALLAFDQDEIAHGFAESNGAQNIQAMSGYLSYLGVAHTLVDYAHFNLDRFHQDLKQYAGSEPILTEWANGRALAGDEGGLHFHFSDCDGIDTGPKGDGVGGAYLWCDGDNSADVGPSFARPPVRYPWPMVQAAQPIAYIIVTFPQPARQAPLPPAFVKAGWKYDGTTLTAPNGVPMVRGFKEWVLDPAHGWRTDDWPLQPEIGLDAVEQSNPSLGAGVRQVCRMTVLEWTQKNGVFIAWGGQEYLWMANALSADQAQTAKQLQAAQAVIDKDNKRIATALSVLSA